MAKGGLGFMHPRSSDCTQFLHNEIKYGGISQGESWGHISQSFLSNFNISGFENFYDGQCLSRGISRKATRQKRKRICQNGLYEEIYGILDEEERDTVRFMRKGLTIKEQKKLCEDWMDGGFVCMASKYKPVAKKVRPVNEAMPQHISPPLQRPELSRDP